MKQQFRVLVIDDNQEIGEMESMLSREGFEVVAAADPVPGLRTVYHEHPARWCSTS